MDSDFNDELKQKIEDNTINETKTISIYETDQTISRLFEEFSLCNLKFKNHFCLMNFSDDFMFDNFGEPTQKYVDFYQMISSSGVGLIFTGSIFAGQKKSKRTKQPIISDNNLFSEMIKNVHTAGSKIFLTISSIYGRNDKNNQFWGNFCYSASNIPSYKDSNLPCIRLSDGKCEEICDEIGNMSKLANFAGFDGVLIKGNSFGIIGEFSSLEFNKRKFGYFNEVFDFGTKIVKKIMLNNPNMIIFYNLTLSTLLSLVYENNLKDIKTIKALGRRQTRAKVLELITKLVKSGVDGFVFEFGTNESEFLCQFNQFQGENFFEEVILDLKDFFQSISLKNKFNENISVIIKDNYNSLETPSKFIVSKQINFVDITKDIYSDINFLKFKKTQKLYKNCLKCSFCNDLSQKYGIIDCTINPSIRYFEQNLLPEKKNKTVAVVGSGISGIVCALTLAKRGYYVDIYEKSKSINKNGRRSEIFGFDQNMKNYNDYLEKQISHFSSKKIVKVLENTEFNDKNDEIEKYSAVVVATGFHERFLEIAGAVLKNVKSIFECLDSYKIFEDKKNIVIYSKTELSLKLALLLLTKNKNVSIVIPSIKFLKDLPNDRLTYYLFALKKLGANVFLFSKIKYIQEDFVELIVNNKLQKYDFSSVVVNYISGKTYLYEAKAKNIDCDFFVYEPDIYPNNKLFYDLVKNNYKGEIYLIGNALEIGGLESDVKSGFFVGKNL